MLVPLVQGTSHRFNQQSASGSGSRSEKPKNHTLSSEPLHLRRHRPSLRMAWSDNVLLRTREHHRDTNLKPLALLEEPKNTQFGWLDGSWLWWGCKRPVSVES